MNPGAKSLTEEEKDIHKNMEDAGIQLPEQACYLSEVTGHTSDWLHQNPASGHFTDVDKSRFGIPNSNNSHPNGFENPA
jgi:hypothetical protein